MRACLSWCLLLFASALLPQVFAEDSRRGIEFFEQRVRPILINRCSRCHGPEKQQGGLRLDRTPYVRQGSESGPVIVPGDPDQSKLIEAVRYHNPRLQMPPTGKLPPQEIETLEQWVRMGAPMPEEPTETVKQGGDFAEVLKQRARHWSYQPLQKVAPPQTRDRSWPRSPVDMFVLYRLEQAGLSPAPEADRATLLRRVSYDLLGLPPTPTQWAAFVNDPRPDAFDRLLDRLLASPHYGERWGRHWLDLVRFAETLGHEFDYDIFNAWRYRDYVIRAFNEDLPYDQFVVEHVAGDLLDPPRRDPVTGLNESIVGTAFWWLGEGKHSPVDVKREEADRIANQLDVFGKAFLGQTLVCARCHHHKFDPVSTEDYYALAGFLTSSRYQQAFLDPPERIAAKAERIARLKQQALQEWLNGQDARRVQQRVRSALVGARKVLNGAPLESAAAETGVEASVLRALADRLTSTKETPLASLPALLSRFAHTDPEMFESALGDLQSALERLEKGASEARSAATDFATFSGGPTWSGDWFVTGNAFGKGPVYSVEAEPPGTSPLRLLRPGVADSRRYALALEGVLRSRTFTIERPFIHVRAAGQGGRIQVVIDNFVLIRNPIYGGLLQNVNRPEFSWYTIDVSMWVGHRAYIEILDSSMPTLTHGLSREAREGRPRSDWIRVDKILFSEDRTPPPDSPPPLIREILSALRHSPAYETLCDLIARQVGTSLHRMREGEPLAASEPDAVALTDLLNLFFETGAIRAEVPAARVAAFRGVEQTIPAPARAPAMADGNPWDEYVHIRGLPESRGPVVPRRFLEVFAGTKPIRSQGSGRLELARQMTDPSVTPVLPRVMANRVWQHHFGRGIVATPDDFGHMGQPPTHPELLEWLATYFVEHGWSVKRLHRLIVLSSTYRMSGKGDPHAIAKDPQNRLYHHMPLRRLEAEAIRDAILAVAGRLDLTMYGPGVLPHLTPFMEGRGRPGQSGPLDGNGRRTIYINVRRNFLTPMLLVFDYPVPFTTIGQRAVSNVPAQALTLMNSPFVVQQARRWAEKLLHEAGTLPPPDRVKRLYLEAFGREPDDTEVAAAVRFVATQAADYGASTEDVRPWADLCHVLINVKEFIYVP